MIRQLAALRGNAARHGGELLLNTRDAVGGLVDRGLCFQHPGLRLRRLGERQVLLLAQDHQAIALLKISQPLFRLLQLFFISFGLGIKEVGGAFRMVEFEMLLQIEIAELFQDRGGELWRVRRIADGNHVRLAHRRNREVLGQASHGGFDAHGFGGGLAKPAGFVIGQAGFGDDLGQEVFTGQQLNF